jgi:GT2 family glycosyltransferase
VQRINSWESLLPRIDNGNWQVSIPNRDTGKTSSSLVPTRLHMSHIDKIALSLGVVICTHNRPVQLENCLKRLMSPGLHDVSVIVVDSAPMSDAARSIAQAYDTGYVVSPLKGLSRARNIGTRALTTDVIAYLDDDMIPSASWLTSMSKSFSDPKIMGATGPILAIGLADASFTAQQEAMAASSWEASGISIDRSCRDWFERVNFGGIGDGNFALRRAAYDEIGGFDDRLGRGASINSGEEHYAYFQVTLAGHRIAYVPEAIVFHPSPGTDVETRKRHIEEASAYLSFLAWNHPQYLPRIIKYILEGAFGKKRSWRQGSRVAIPALSVWNHFRSGLRGVLGFWEAG